MGFLKADTLSDCVDVWHLNVDGIVFEDFSLRYSYMLSADEIEKINGFMFEKDRLICLVSRVLLRLSLSSYSSCKAPEDWTFSREKYGKPYLVDGGSGELKFNLTHSGSFVCCAVTTAGEVGVDIETTTFIKDVDGVVNRFFATEEKEFLKTLAEYEKQPFFFRLWTIKESYVKALGVGMNIPFDSFCINTESILNARVDVRYEFDRANRKWQFFSQTHSRDAYPVAVAVLTDCQLNLVWRDASALLLSM
ncbi:4'-phosphopantetheinyl transferase family protein [Cellvibrio mixtus]|uniref:4'-phosphopantetheinyl transferase family protein n=1 Tax=Cellvibrio mixtus TaxID=39650 RepID=UPI00069503EF|nr:4'-phosphopantetheinyl transferase superfamily protein [Cellvibrio mixtus]